MPNEDESNKNEKMVEFTGDKTLMPNLVNYSKRDAIKILNNLGLKYQVVGSGKVVAQSVKYGTKLKGIAVCNLMCNTAKSNSKLRIN